MECPNCKEDQAVVLHTDPITCGDCDSVVNIEYCVCMNCNYSFRLNNGIFMDGAPSGQNSVDEALAEICEKCDEELYNSSVNSMSDLIHNCVKCGQPSAYVKNDYVYACSMCGFEWEILSSE